TVAFAIIAFICLIADESAVWASGGDRLRNGRRKPSRLLVAACVAASWAPFSVSQRPAASLVNAIRDATVNPTVVAIGSDMAFGHPLTRMIGGRWVSRYCADWLGVFALYLKVKAVKDGDSDKAAFYQTMLETFVDEKKREFEVRPDIVVFRKDEPFWTARMLAEFGFSEILDEYKVIAEGK